MRLLFVCTGNLCRSPVAAGLTEAWVRRTAAGEARLVDVRSAGTDAPVGEPMDRHSAAALLELGGDPAGRHAVALSADLAASADLVLTMTRAHRRAALELAPRGLRRTFTLREAADLVRDVDLHDLAGLPLDQRARELCLRLDARRPFRASTAADDIEDPVGRPGPVHERVASSIADALQPVVTALFHIDDRHTRAGVRRALPAGR